MDLSLAKQFSCHNPYRPKMLANPGKSQGPSENFDEFGDEIAISCPKMGQLVASSCFSPPGTGGAGGGA
jgi:hypothetical protein